MTANSSISRKNRIIGKLENKNYFDYSLLFIIIFLILFGLVMLYSTSSYNAQTSGKGATFYLKKQAFSTAIGLFVMFIVVKVGYKRIKYFTKYIFGASMLTVPLVLSPLGIESHGAKRWVGLMGFSFQPAEFVKLGSILFLAYIISRYAKEIYKFKNFFLVLLLAAIPSALVAGVTSNLSSAIIIFGIAYVMLFVATPKWIRFIIPVLLGLVGFYALYKLGGSFRANRIRVWIDPQKYSASGGFQIMQGLYAIGSGGIFGKGLGNSVQKLGFIPEAQNDYIFTIICEELGLIGAVAVILMFLFMIWRFFIIANNAPDIYSSMVVIGVMAHISIQVILNIAVVTNTIPNTGITLPFISYGGTSVLFLLVEMGLVLSISKDIKIK